MRLADLHSALASPRALELAQVTGPVDFPDGSEIVCVDGVPTGELHEPGAQELILRAAPALRWPELRERHVAQLRRLNALGLTGAHVMDGSPETFELLRDLEGTGELTLRLRVPLWVQPDTPEDELEHWLRLRDERGELWRGGVAKFFADGVIDAGTAWLQTPDTHGDGLTPFWPDPERMAAAMARFAGAGFQLATHTIGDAAVRFTLDAYARAGGRGHRLEHLETLPDDLVRAVARSGYTASMQPVHLNAIGPNWNERLGPERAARAFRMRDLLDAGAPLTLGSDWPVGDADPRLGMIAARRHGLTGEEALAGYTLAPVRAVGEAGGRIRVGLRADLTGMAEDPVHAPDAPVWLTVVAGRVVHHHGDVVARRLRPAAGVVPSNAGRSRRGALARG